MYDSSVVAKVSASAVIESPVTTGVLRYQWSATDTNASGEFRAEFDVIYTGGEKLTVPVKGNIVVRVYDDLNNL